MELYNPPMSKDSIYEIDFQISDVFTGALWPSMVFFYTDMLLYRILAHLDVK